LVRVCALSGVQAKRWGSSWSQDATSDKVAGRFNRRQEQKKQKGEKLMKKQAYTMIAMIIIVGSMAVAAQAQTSGRTQLRVDIPFQFNVGDMTMAPGEYIVRSVSDDASDVIVKIQSRDGKSSAMLRMMTVEGPALESAKLVFNRYGNQYFLAQAWVDGQKSRLEALKSRGERAAGHELAGLKMAAESIALTARR
jgi:hypothetical protein